MANWSSQLFDLRAPSSTDVPVLLLNQPISWPARPQQRSQKSLRKSSRPSFLRGLKWRTLKRTPSLENNNLVPRACPIFKGKALGDEVVVLPTSFPGRNPKTSFGSHGPPFHANRLYMRFFRSLLILMRFPYTHPIMSPPLACIENECQRIRFII